MDPNNAIMEFHIARRARDRYQFEDSLFSLSGNVVFANFHGARQFSQRMNTRRDLVNFPEQAVRAGQINAMGLIDEILHFVIAQYRRERSPQAMDKATEWLTAHLGAEALDKALRHFSEQFPPVSVYRRETSLDDYLSGFSGGISHRQIVLEEMVMLWLANMDPAFNPFMELFDDGSLKKETAYLPIITSLHEFFDTQPPYGPENQNLIDMLRAPAIAVPYSLEGQLEYIRERWGLILGKYLYRLLSSLDLLKEEQKAIFLGPGPSRPYDFTGLELEQERFSPDKDWMPSLVLMAKNAYVWLDQLSKKYKRPINRLDQIPEEELESMARGGFTGLWLIGLWERSQASKRIKQLRGNAEAVASAYSLFSYEVAADLGGEEAYRALRDRAWVRGIRLASDMVPNHMGIDSRWVIEHPEWFVSLDYSPFPSYTFDGPNLSWDERIGLYLEDHYYNNTDAAVVFKRVDNGSGSSKYLYHGNDGTSMPWNDTAQLNYLSAEVREAVIQTILEVARKFPVIRFDAAMTLAKKHYQRLWFPEPGSGGDIPSRAGFGLTKEQFDTAMPVEFWREVVDRVAQEVPDTLLLAEAFWMMEGYFVRTLGMHRVYNSAFMNMLRDEKNQEYRLVIKNTLEFDPEILKRYVNFMNNPDERTAVDQFGKGDKYFGICTVMATLPGLPMFGHGQIEGYTEKYGMEFRRAYSEESPDPYLVSRHEREIFPLLRRRYLFAQVQDFLLFDFYTPEGYVNEDVYAYSNRAGDDRTLVIYHNKYAETCGWVRISAAYPVKSGQSDGRTLVQKSLGEGLGLHNEEAYFTVFRDHTSGLEYIRNSQELHNSGMYVELGAYKAHVFLDFREILDNQWRQYAQLAAYLNGQGVPSIAEALKEIFLQPVHTPFNELVNAGLLRWIITNRSGAEAPEIATQASVLEEVETKVLSLLEGIARLTGDSGDSKAIAAQVCQETDALLHMTLLARRFPLPRSRKYQKALKYLMVDQLGTSLDEGDPRQWGSLMSFIITRRLGQVTGSAATAEQSRTWIDEWLLGKIISQTLVDLGVGQAAAGRAVAALKLIVGHQDWWKQDSEEKLTAYKLLQDWLKDSDLQAFLGVNRYQGLLWFNKESFEELLWWFYAAAVLDVTTGPELNSAEVTKQIINLHSLITALQAAETDSGFQVDKLLAAAKK